MAEYKKYEKLNKKFEYDREVVETLAEAISELGELAQRAAYLNELIDQNKKLKKFLWTTGEGVIIPLHKIENDHLKNIMAHIVEHNAVISPQIKAEALSRGFDIPGSKEGVRAIHNYINGKNFIEAEILTDDYGF